MGQQQSREELLYQQVSYGNVEGIKALRAQGAGLEWIDREGKTPLILASMNSELYNVAKALIELGANVNAYRPGRNAGTPLHHAAKRGLEPTVKLLLSHGGVYVILMVKDFRPQLANTLLMNDDCQTPLDVARVKGCTSVVRAIESHICLFSGWLRELYGPGFLEVLAPQLLSRRVWVAVLPCGSRNLAKPFKLELAIYSTLQAFGWTEVKVRVEATLKWIHWIETVGHPPSGNPMRSCALNLGLYSDASYLGTDSGIAQYYRIILSFSSYFLLCCDSQPRTLIALWKANMEEPKFNQPDPTVIISDIPNISRRWRRRRGILTSREARCKSRGVRRKYIEFWTDKN
ncbi:hypothetical protein RHSIM_Rhsim04G0180500 [Rhododendron simsii]|uniref:E3 ubiquitin-protein ligase XBAT35 n=1 Tax=Rhododendron simsii TaxID=118357 RepID=A0A834H3Y9_RHOSS|nr:hypothetical protein RHSIM_Rhsim04G0180500 [Rhododendron simsii]